MNIKDWVKQNTKGVANKAFLGMGVADIAGSENKLTATVKLIRDWVLFVPILQLGMSRLFSGMSKSIRSLVSDTGSLDAGLRKLSQIKELTRMLAPLVGGVEAAKSRVAELVNLSSHSNFKFEQFGQASRSLQVFTRGMFSSARAVDVVADAAAGTNNGLGETADAVGAFYSALRNGEPIAAAADSLRQMGILSGQEAAQLDRMAASGAHATEMTDELTRALERHKGGQAAARDSDSPAAAQAGYDKAAAGLQTALGSPFVESDVQNTKNMTDAMNAIAPSVARVASFLAVLTGGFSTLKSWLLKTAGESSGLRTILEGLVIGFSSLVAAVSVVSGIALGVKLIGWGSAAGYMAGRLLGAIPIIRNFAFAINALFVTTRIAFLLTGIGLIVAALATLAAISYSVYSAQQKAEEAVRKQAEAHREAADAIRAHINAITSLTEKHEAQAEALAELIKLQDELNNLWSTKTPGSVAQKAKQEGELEGSIERAKRNLEKAGNAAGLEPSDEQKRILEMQTQRNKALDEESYRAAMENATPQGKQDIRASRIADLSSRAKRGEMGLNAAEDVRAKRENLTDDIAKAKADVGFFKSNYEAQVKAGSTPSIENIRYAQGELDKVQAKQLALGLNAPKDSSVYAETVAAQIGHALSAQAATTPSERAHYETLAGGAQPDAAGFSAMLDYAHQRRAAEGEVAGVSSAVTGLTSEQQQGKRELYETERRAEVEKQIADLKTRGVARAQQESTIRKNYIDEQLAAEQGRENPDQAKIDSLNAQRADIERGQHDAARQGVVAGLGVEHELAGQRAALRGDGREMVKLGDLERFTSKFEELRDQFGDKKAKQLATEYAQNSIDLNARSGAQQYNAALAADSLAKIGGGGNVAMGGDPMLEAAKRHEDLLKESVGYLKTIAGADDSGID